MSSMVALQRQPHHIHAGGLLPLCDFCQRTGASACCHCVPRVPEGQGCSCGSAWSTACPVEAGWVTELNGKLYSLGCMIDVAVYNRKCSNR